MSDKDTPLKNMLSHTNNLKDEEDGAVSVDWVVITAALVGLAASAGLTAQDGINALGSKIATSVSTKSVDNGG